MAAKKKPRTLTTIFSSKAVVYKEEDDAFKCLRNTTEAPRSKHIYT